jgi:hypothetical protein
MMETPHQLATQMLMCLTQLSFGRITAVLPRRPVKVENTSEVMVNVPKVPASGEPIGSVRFITVPTE